MTLSTRQMTLVAMMAALTAISAYLVLPVGPVPATLQSSVVLASGALLGSRLGALSQMVYLVMGLIGLPVFAGGRSGLGILVTPTFGYLIGFVAAAYITGLIIEKYRIHSLSSICGAMLAGSAVLMLCGVIYLYFNLSMIVGQETSWPKAFSIGVLPFLPFEVLKITLSVGVVYTLKRHSSVEVDTVVRG